MFLLGRTRGLYAQPREIAKPNLCCYKLSVLRKLAILGPSLLGGSIGLAARHRKVAAAKSPSGRAGKKPPTNAYKLGAADEATTDLFQCDRWRGN